MTWGVFRYAFLYRSTLPLSNVPHANSVSSDIVNTPLSSVMLLHVPQVLQSVRNSSIDSLRVRANRVLHVDACNLPFRWI